LEITENILIQNPDLASDIISQLNKREVRVYLDDFGSGYSSLSYLHRFPIDALKIDRSFVSGLNQSEGRNTEIVRAMIQLAQNLRLGVIAEGIEKLEELNRLRGLGCENGQGFLLARPAPPSDVEANSLLSEDNENLTDWLSV